MEHSVSEETHISNENELSANNVRIDEIENNNELTKNKESQPLSLVTEADGLAEDSDDLMDSDEELRNQLSGLHGQVSELLPMEDIPTATLEYDGVIYPLFTEQQPEADVGGHIPGVVEDKSLIHTEFNVFIGAIRLFLQRKYGVLSLASKEIFVEFPDLGLQLNEDNVYVKRMTMDDILSIFKTLRKNSIKNEEPNIPDTIRTVVSLRPRFVSRYNDLVEIMDNSGSFATAHGFSNDESHPVVVDEINNNNMQVADRSEIIVMDSDEASLRTSDSDIEILN